MSKFKVGDKVRVIKASNLFGMSRLIGKVGIISRDDGSGIRQYRLDIDDPTNPWSESELELVEPRREFIVIRRDGAKTIAELRHDREVIKSGTATCAPSDTFDFDTGAKLAFDRLMGRDEPQPEPKPPHRFKVGDRVVEKKVGYGDGEIVAILRGLYDVKFSDRRLYLTEDRLFPAPEPPKFYTGKVVMVDCEFPDRKHLINHMFEFKDGRQVGNKVHGMSFNYAPYTSFEQIVSTHNASTWIEVKE